MKHRPYTHGLVLVIIFVAVGYATLTGGTFRSRSHAFAAPITGLTLPGVSSSIPTADQSVLRPSLANRTSNTAAPVADKHREVAEQLARIYATPTAEPSPPAEDPLLRAAAVAPPPPEPKLEETYIVKDGDNVSKIAAQFGLTVQTIIDNNPEIPNSDFLVLGQQVLIPPGEGILHNIHLNDTISGIADTYGVELAAITAYAPNHLSSPDTIVENKLVFVPGGKKAAPVAVPLPAAGSGTSTDSGTSANAGIVAGGAKSEHGLIWPIGGPVSSSYGPSHPLGLDIDGYRSAGAPVGAATSGTVVFAGGNACCSYGLYVVVMSAGGIETLYAHLSSIAVSQGETVAQGEEVGIIGSTGYSTGTHLHFEVIDNGTRVNPAAYLP
jgi:murein DD-endopeptidase MepM/ murein hydrolase activator NlpD